LPDIVPIQHRGYGDLGGAKLPSVNPIIFIIAAATIR
jgi:hypothetical protein